MRALPIAFALGLLVAGCGGATTDESFDAPVEDAGADASTDAPDAAIDGARPDAQPDVAVDAVPDAGADVVVDVNVDAPPSCANCTGCCDPGGNCRAGGDPAACGKGGAACSDCTVVGLGCDSNGTCSGAPPPCGPTTCSGCCDAQGVCRPGDATDTCGKNGGSCDDCAAKSEGCSQGKCQGAAPACGASSCGGCCDANGVCRAGTDSAACGQGGGACADCASQALSCIGASRYCGNVPLCGALTCPNGCCDANGTCRDGRADAACGTNGAACADCGATGKACAPVGYCYSGKHCGPDTCAGCCSPNGDCQAGTDAAACGAYGNVCASCGAGSTCQSGACSSGSTCPAPYAGCAPGTVTAPPTHSTSCSDADLGALAAACAGTDPGTSCNDAFAMLAQKNLACFACIDQFLGSRGYARCLAPWLTADCNAALTCALECSDAVCGDCTTQSSADQCGKQAYSQGGACQTWILAGTCTSPALGGPASFCDYESGKTDAGQWIYGVGLYYCH